MAWFAVAEQTTGRLVSVGQEVAPADELLARGLIAQPLADRPNDNQMWDSATRTFVARPASVLVDRFQDLLDHPDYGEFRTAYNSLSAANKTRLRNGLIRLLGRQRYRLPEEDIAVG